MRIQFLGANRQVTGSRYFVETDKAKVIVDCGMFQEREFLGRNWARSNLPLGEIDTLLLTHAHIDHSGLIPRLVREGFRGRIVTTHPTVELIEILLEDSAKIYCGIQAFGTPEQLVEKLRSRRELLGEFDLLVIPHYGGMPLELAEQSLRLFAEKVIPALR